MTVVALTGGIAAGKSTVSEFLAAEGAKLIYADELARKAVEAGSKGLEKVVNRFGGEFLTSTGELDRSSLAKTIFNDPKAREDLNKIVHPIVRLLFAAAVDKAKQDHPDRVLVYEIPLLVETSARENFDLVVVVHAPAQIRAQRLVVERGLSPVEAEARINAQSSDEDRLAVADLTINAAVDPAVTREGALELYQGLADHWPGPFQFRSKHLPSIGS